MNEREVDFAGLFRDSLARGVAPEDARRDVLRKRFGSLEAAADEVGVHKSTLDLIIGGWTGGEKAIEARARLAKKIGLPEDVMWPHQEAA